MKTNGISSALWNAFISVNGVAVGLIGLAIALVAWAWKPETEIKLSIAIAVTILSGLALLFAILTKALIDTNKELNNTTQNLIETIKNQKQQIPRAILCKKIETTKGVHQTIILLEASDLFLGGMAVSFSYVDQDGFERLIGHGYISVIQDDKRIQATLTNLLPGQDDIANKLLQNNRQTLDTLRTKPYLSHPFLTQITQGPTNANT
ncbi:hypothetical protein [Archangium lipolyticum]|uniref:hypothetical protein n=1 Tax=Archangium lipolyticum TaxID=2970465 RepID=UPI00214A4D21|nr:hypothetical protein [Archangium lipolyticum]